MLSRRFGSLAVLASAVGLFLQVSIGQGQAEDRRQECSAKYKAAKAEGTLGGLTWPQFLSRCVVELKSAPETPAEAAPAAAATEPVNPLKPPPAAPTRPAAVETAPPATSAAEAPVAPKPKPTPTETVTAAPPSSETVKPTTAPKVAPVPSPAATATPAAPPPATESVKGAAPAPREPVFPTAIAPAYTKDKAYIARQKTCLDQYKANKATDSNGGLKWIEKGGGYLSLCNKHLKGQS